MSLKKTLGVVAFGSAVALALNGAGCGSGSGGAGGTAGTGTGGTTGSGTTGAGGASGTSATGGSSGTGAGGSKGVSSGGTKGAGGSSGVFGDSGMDSGGGMCMPASLTGFKGGLNPSANSAGGCSTAIITQIVDECFGGNPDAGATACTDLISGNAAAKKCIQGCIQTPWTSDTTAATWKSDPWGAIWYMAWGTTNPVGFFDGINLGGCFVAADPTNAKAKACATDLEENIECFMQACADNCPLPCDPMVDGPTCTVSMSDYTTASNALTGCINMVNPTSGSGDCTASLTKANTDCASFLSVDSGPVGECNSAYQTLYTAGLTNAQYTTALTQLFDVVCGPASGGGG